MQLFLYLGKWCNTQGLQLEAFGWLKHTCRGEKQWHSCSRRHFKRKQAVAPAALARLNAGDVMSVPACTEIR